MSDFYNVEPSKLAHENEQAEIANDTGLTQDGVNIKVINNRLGRIILNLENAIYIPFGLIGMPEETEFCLAEPPFPDLKHYRLIQAVHNEAVTFMTLPIDKEDNKLFEPEDLQNLSTLAGIEYTNLDVYVIVAAKKLEDGSKVVRMNLRAPILVDKSRKLGIQYAFTNERYSMQHEE
jgi:flagellar assembly factor FliW